jgi:hypothetical protein
MKTAPREGADLGNLADGYQEVDMLCTCVESSPFMASYAGLPSTQGNERNNNIAVMDSQTCLNFKLRSSVCQERSC